MASQNQALTRLAIDGRPSGTGEVDAARPRGYSFPHGAPVRATNTIKAMIASNRATRQPARNPRAYPALVPAGRTAAEASGSFLIHPQWAQRRGRSAVASSVGSGRPHCKHFDSTTILHLRRTSHWSAIWPTIMGTLFPVNPDTLVPRCRSSVNKLAAAAPDAAPRPISGQAVFRRLPPACGLLGEKKWPTRGAHGTDANREMGGV
jgi:hypothetical protein